MQSCRTLVACLVTVSIGHGEVSGSGFPGAELSWKCQGQLRRLLRLTKENYEYLVKLLHPSKDPADTQYTRNTTLSWEQSWETIVFKYRSNIYFHILKNIYILYNVNITDRNSCLFSNVWILIIVVSNDRKLPLQWKISSWFKER